MVGDISSTGETALHFAVKWGHQDIAEMLIEANAADTMASADYEGFDSYLPFLLLPVSSPLPSPLLFHSCFQVILPCIQPFNAESVG